MQHAKHSLFPRNIREQISDLNTKLTYLKANVGRLGITNTDLAALETQVIAVNAAQASVDNKDTRTKLDTARRKMALDTAHKTMRKIIDYYVVQNPNATSVDIEALNVPVPGTHTNLSVPNHIPGIGHITSCALIIKVPFYNAQDNNIRGKPEGAKAIEVAMKIGGEPPENLHGMTEQRIFTASPIYLAFGPEQEFEPLYLAFRWIGTRGHFGQWSEIYKVMITR